MKRIRVGKQTNQVWAFVDDEDFERVYEFGTWSETKVKNTSYAHNYTTLNKNMAMHRLILNLYEYDHLKQIDHIDGNGLNNQKSNLRIVSGTLNNLNKNIGLNKTSKYKGVSYSNRDKLWSSFYSNKRIGYFDNEIDCALYRDWYLKQLFNEKDIVDRMLNFPDFDGIYPIYTKLSDKRKYYSLTKEGTYKVDMFVNNKRYAKRFKIEQEAIDFVASLK